jgi:hypothetical protein
MIDLSICVFTPKNHCTNDVTECVFKVDKNILQISINGNPYVDINNDYVVILQTDDQWPYQAWFEVFSIAPNRYEYRDSIKSPISRKRGSAKKVCKKVNKWITNQFKEG